MAFVDNDALVTVLTRILETFATKEELEAIEAGGVTVDAALSSTSTNPVQNKAVKAALDGKASSSHEHAAGDISSGTLSVARGGTGATTAPGALAKLGALPVQDLSINTTAPGTANYGRTLTVTSASSDKYYIGIDEYGKLWGGQAINNASSITWHPAIMNNSNNGAVSITASSFEINNATLYVHSSAIWAPWLSLKSGNTMYFYPNDQTALYAWMDKQTTGVRFCPQADAKGAIGHNNYRWNSIYSSNGTIQTSDRRKKKDISDDISVYKDILSEVTPVQYRYNDIEGDKVRIGFIAQDLDSIFEKHGLNPRDFAAIRLDDVDPTDTIPDGKVYGLSYDGFVALNTALIQDLQKENTELKNKLAAMEERLARLEEKIGS